MTCAPHLARPSSKSAPRSERVLRPNAIRIKRSRTPAHLPKFNVQLFERVTNSRFFHCDQSPLISGDYKLPGGGAHPLKPWRRRGAIPQSRQRCCLVSPLLSIVCASHLLTILIFSVVCAYIRGEGGYSGGYGPGASLTDWTGGIPDTFEPMASACTTSTCHGKRAVLWNRSFDSYSSMTGVSTR